MNIILRKLWFTSLSLSCFLNVLDASFLENPKKIQMIQELEVIKHHFEVGYAPAQWKKEFSGWDLDLAFENSKQQILDAPHITTKQFQGIVRDFLRTMNDYHVDVLFLSTEAASLPFTVKSIDGRVFVDWVDPLRLPFSKFGIKVGDELLEFDERVISDVMNDLIAISGKYSNPQTDQSLADLKLTLRRGKEGDVVPKGSVIVKMQSADSGKVNSYQLRWTYMSENVPNPRDLLESIKLFKVFSTSPREEISRQFSEMRMANPLYQSFNGEVYLRDGGLAARKSFIPFLGIPIWEIENPEPLDDNDEFIFEDAFWHAYIYKHPNGYPIGYVRIPHFDESELNDFKEIIKFMEKHTEALVVDLVNNTGGSSRNLYDMASMLTSKPMRTPYHRIKLTHKQAYDSYRTLQLIKAIEHSMQNLSDNDQEQEEDDGGISYQQLLFYKAYHEFIVENWAAGRVISDPIHLLGVDLVNPNPHSQYTKPILVLINELDISGGDFFPAILQDNKRAVLFGTRTAGAGGFVRQFEFPNRHGIALCSYTASIAERPDLQKIENLGVTPDLEYQLTVDDIRGGYRGYISAVNGAVRNLILNEKKTETPSMQQL